jgi:YD repeat-containing protein
LQNYNRFKEDYTGFGVRSYSLRFDADFTELAYFNLTFPKETSDSSNIATYTPDNIGNITQIANPYPGNGLTKFQYDAPQNLLTITDANNHKVLGTSGNQYDLRNRLTRSCDARGNCTTYKYDSDDNLTQATSGVGTVTQYQYDNLNRRSEIDYGVVSGNPTSKVTLSYDLGDRLTQAVDSPNSNGTITRQYGSGFDLANGWDFITNETTSQGSVSYGEPDAAGRRTTMTVTAGTTAEPTVTFSFDDAGKLTSVTQNGLTASKTFNDPAGPLKTLRLPNNLAVTYGYDRDSHVTSLSYGTLGTLNYGYDADGRRVSVGGSLASLPAPQPTQSFSFNPDNSLKRSAPARSRTTMTAIFYASRAIFARLVTSSRTTSGDISNNGWRIPTRSITAMMLWAGAMRRTSAE